jgi:hypothetical protein
MAGNTSPHNITYPTSGDNVAPLETVFANMATSVETAMTTQDAANSLKSYTWANTAARTAQTGMVAGSQGYQTDIATIYFYNGSSWVVWTTATSLAVLPGITAGTNFTVNISTYRFSSGVITINLIATKSTAFVAGDTVVTLPAGFRSAMTDNGFSGWQGSGGAQNAVALAMTASTGVITVGANSGSNTQIRAILTFSTV